MTYLAFTISILLLMLFAVLYKARPYRLINGFILDCSAVSLVLSILMFLNTRQSVTAEIILWVVVATIIAVTLFFLFLLMGYLVLNSIKMAKNERRNWKNGLSLILFGAILIQLAIVVFIMQYVTNQSLIGLLLLILVVESYVFIGFLSYVTISIIILLDRRSYKKNHDYLIVLGCGLLDGDRVPPLLAGRIDKAITIYHHKRELGQFPKLIFSGGQGNDETISEAEAMKKYAIKNGINSEDILIEKDSCSTLENLMHSKKIMDKMTLNDYTCTYVTSDYHVFRAGVYASLAGLKEIHGIGSRTEWYYITNALIREYAALFIMNKKVNLIMVNALIVIYFMIWIALAFMMHF